MKPYEVAQAILREYWDLKLPINPEVFAEKLQINIVRTPELKAKSGYFDLEDRTIYVNANEDEARQRFTIAHELGHYCLGHGTSDRVSGDPDWPLKLQQDAEEIAKKEAAANEFAGELLVPGRKVEELILGQNIWDFKKLVDLFQVSPEAMIFQLDKLGYFDVLKK